jgi:hypothetical protein
MVLHSSAREATSDCEGVVQDMGNVTLAGAVPTSRSIARQDIQRRFAHASLIDSLAELNISELVACRIYLANLGLLGNMEMSCIICALHNQVLALLIWACDTWLAYFAG